jgi:hypothetical protein
LIQVEIESAPAFFPTSRTPEIWASSMAVSQPTLLGWSALPPVTYKKNGGSGALPVFKAPSPPDSCWFLQPTWELKWEMHAASNIWIESTLWDFEITHMESEKSLGRVRGNANFENSDSHPFFFSKCCNLRPGMSQDFTTCKRSADHRPHAMIQQATWTNWCPIKSLSIKIFSHGSERSSHVMKIFLSSQDWRWGKMRARVTSTN